MEPLQPTLGLTFFFVIPREIGGVIVQIDELTGFNDILRFKFHFLIVISRQYQFSTKTLSVVRINSYRLSVVSYQLQEDCVKPKSLN